jgi:hypothetical protein
MAEVGPAAPAPMIATTGQQTTSGPLTSLDPLALTGAGGAAAVAGANPPIPHRATSPARTINLAAMIIVPAPNTARAPDTVPAPTNALAPDTVPARTNPLALDTVPAPTTALAATTNLTPSTGPTPTTGPRATAAVPA